MAKLTKKQIKKTEVLNDTIDDLELENMSETEIEETVKKVLSLQKPKQERIDAWRNEAKAGNLFNSTSEEIPVYKSWNKDIERLENMTAEDVKNLNIYRF